MTIEKQVQKSETQLRIEADIKAAMFADEKPKVKFLRLLLSEIQGKAKELRVEYATEATAIEALTSFKKRQLQELQEFQKAGRAERVAVLQVEFDTVVTYLPAQMSEEEVQKVVRDIITKLGDKANMGTVMKEAGAVLDGKAEKQTISGVAKDLLAK